MWYEFHNTSLIPTTKQLHKLGHSGQILIYKSHICLSVYNMNLPGLAQTYEGIKLWEKAQKTGSWNSPITQVALASSPQCRAVLATKQDSIQSTKEKEEKEGPAQGFIDLSESLRFLTSQMIQYDE